MMREVMPIDYRKYYFLETMLFPELRRIFQRTGELTPENFWCILIWKANRAKAYAKRRLTKNGKTFAESVTELAKSLHGAQSCRRRLEILMMEWGFKLPTATAILTVLYPNYFTIYDSRVREFVTEFDHLKTLKFGDDLWNDYKAFVNAVRAMRPSQLRLREKDRYLWGRSLFNQVQREVQ